MLLWMKTPPAVVAAEEGQLELSGKVMSVGLRLRLAVVLL